MSSARPVTIITGGGRGIGAATARVLAAAGHDLVLSYRSDRAAAQELADELPTRARAVCADVTDPAAVEHLFTAATELGPVTGLVNNAGVTLLIADLADTPVPTVRETLEVNLLGPVLCARRAVQVMSTRRGGPGGAIVNVSSGAATLGSPHEYVYYAAAKAGVDALTVGLSKELGPDGIRVNAVAPGVVRTGIHAAAGDPGRVERIGAQVPLGRAAEPVEIARSIAWLLGPESSYTTGTVLRVAGGR